MTTPTDPVALARALAYAVLPMLTPKAARDLTKEQARDIVVSYALTGLIELEKPVTLGKDGRPTWPKVGDKSKLKLDNIGGVRWVPDNQAASGWTHTGRMDLRTAVLAVRLAQYLNSSRWGVTEIYWGGMGVGRDENDRHGQGLAIDIHGVWARSGWIDVWFDWGKQPITLPSGKTVTAWPATQAPSYRLDTSTTAGGFFFDLYQYLTGEAVDRGGSAPSSIGQRSFILHPDHPDNTLRPNHQDHVHCEIGR
jgi:hypothetical protein